MVNVPANSLVCMVLVVCLLAASSLFLLVLRKRNPETDYSELSLRIKSWWYMILIVFAVLALSNTLAVIFFGFLSFIALKEFLSVVPTRSVDRKVIFWAYLAIPVQYYLVSTGWYGMFIIFIPIYMFLLLPMRMVLTGETKGFIRSVGVIHWAVMLMVFFVSHIPYLLCLPVKNPEAGGIGTILFLLIMTQFNDVSQYCWGKMFGKHKIIPKVSPNKTWEGFLGGVLTITVCSGLTAPLLTPISGHDGIILGALLSVCGFFGDVVISSVKRDLRIKDSGSLIPGHGGILDRMDSLFYTAPVFFHYLYYLYY